MFVYTFAKKRLGNVEIVFEKDFNKYEYNLIIFIGGVPKKFTLGVLDGEKVVEMENEIENAHHIIDIFYLLSRMDFKLPLAYLEGYLNTINFVKKQIVSVF